jgi:hypothetical protein
MAVSTSYYTYVNDHQPTNKDIRVMRTIPTFQLSRPSEALERVCPPRIQFKTKNPIKVMTFRNDGRMAPKYLR